MKQVFFTIAICLCSLFCLSQKTLIWCGTLIDGVADDPKKNMTIVIEKEKIIAIETGFTQAGANDKVVDLKTKTVTPGWIDMHVHLEGETKKGNLADRFILNQAGEQLFTQNL